MVGVPRVVYLCLLCLDVLRWSISAYGVRFTCMWPITCFIVIRMYMKMYTHHDGAASSPFRVSMSTAAHRLRGERAKGMV